MKRFAILIAILVCALNVMGAAPQTTSGSRLSPLYIGERISEARRLLQATFPASGDSVRLAVLDPESAEVSIVPLTKDEFLTKDAVLSATSNRGSQVRVQIVRANGVNTAVNATAANGGQELLPLMVQYPIVKNGGITEVAYYTSAHPALLSAELSFSGQSYVRGMLDDAAARLAARGVSVPSDIVDIAEHLCVVEHTDHRRFNTENQGALFPEILSLYALNQGNTFRYSVSTAGAGGMIQMIPKTYEGIRQNHPAVPLNSDFVSGMRDHANALEAMLLYMNDTWNGLAKSSEVQAALDNGIATKSELLAAGYNSNPTRLPAYLKNGGNGWRALIPAETQMYLAIYSSVDRNLQLGPDKSSPAVTNVALSVEAGQPLPILSWLGQTLISTSSLALFR
jgi:hypothetical protein